MMKTSKAQLKESWKPFKPHEHQTKVVVWPSGRVSDSYQEALSLNTPKEP